jgi:hypothetical protein
VGGLTDSWSGTYGGAVIFALGCKERPAIEAPHMHTEMQHGLCVVSNAVSMRHNWPGRGHELLLRLVIEDNP